jgi:hypothetical protein
MNKEDYLHQFEDEQPIEVSKPRIEKALDLALDIRKFEIELYWKRATYFWTFIGASIAGYALIYAKGQAADTWLLLVFSCLGFLFSLAWYLVNRGSKFWQNNWERHVDLLEDFVSGPLYKTIARNAKAGNFLTDPAEYSVSKINQILSLFITVFWCVLIWRSLAPFDVTKELDIFKAFVLLITVSAMICLLWFGKSSNQGTDTKLSPRKVEVNN